MKTKNIFYIFLLIMSSILLSSCGSSGVPNIPLESPYKEFRAETEQELAAIKEMDVMSGAAFNKIHKTILTCIVNVASNAHDTVTVRELVEKAFDDLKPLEELELETEEREYVAGTLYSLAELANVNVGEKANAWMYGEAMAMMAAGKKPPIIRTAESQCENCGAKFTTHIYEDLKALPDCWESVICTHCNTAVVITSPRGIGESADYKSIRPYMKSDYSISQVKADIERARKAGEYPFNDTTFKK